MSAAIQTLQQWLVDHAVDCGGVDGVWGPKTAYGLARAVIDEIGVPATLLESARAEVRRMVPLRSQLLDAFGVIKVRDKVKPVGACELINREWLSNLVSVTIFGNKCRVHRKIAGAVIMAEAECRRYASAPYPKRLPTVVQTYCLRHMCWNPKRHLSYHSWGIALDIDPATNPMGTRGDIPLWVAEKFEEWGFTWGGNWSGKQADPMHFEWLR